MYARLIKSEIAVVNDEKLMIEPRSFMDGLQPELRFHYTCETRCIF